MPAVELRHIVHAYGDTIVLPGLSLTVATGSITTLLGSSGCGKTTLLRIIAGLEVPRAGEVLLEGRCVTRDGRLLIPPERRGIGFIFQDLALWPHMTVFRNIAFGLQARREKDTAHKVHEVLDEFGLTALARHYPHQLSGGQRQLVAIARALVLEPSLLLMDEPLANLDVKLKKKILDHIRALRDKYHLTILYVTHDHREAFSLADKVVVIREGNVEASGTVDEIRRSANEYVRYFLEY